MLKYHNNGVLIFFIFFAPKTNGMDIISILILAIGLSMDSFAVSLASGIGIKDLNKRDASKIALTLGFFQGMMPVAGWAVGMSFSKYIINYDHWIAFVILLFLGVKMIIEGIKDSDESCSDPLKLTTLLSMSIATSIDALAVGVSIALLKQDIVFPSIIIGAVTVLFSIIGLYSGKILGCRFKSYAEIAGGLILIGIGTKILIEHTMV